MKVFQCLQSEFRAVSWTRLRGRRNSVRRFAGELQRWAAWAA